MARTARGPLPAGIYHVWRRTAGPVQMFRDDYDRTSFCNRLARVATELEWTCLAFVLMRTHFHLVLSVEDGTLSSGMQKLFGPYAQAFNYRWKRKGHLRAEPFKCRWVDDDRDLIGVTRYVARNPIRAKACRQPQDWYWSSYPGTAGYAKQFHFVDDSLLLTVLDDRRDIASQLLRGIVETS